MTTEYAGRDLPYRRCETAGMHVTAVERGTALRPVDSPWSVGDQSSAGIGLPSRSVGAGDAPMSSSSA
jgi:hypothetical protein